MRILITNDDGIASPALPRLAMWARRHGDVTVAAPKVEQSGKSHAIEFYREMEIKKVDIGCDVEAYCVDSTPADCVKYAVLGLGVRYDLCFRASIAASIWGATLSIRARRAPSLRRRGWG